MYVNITAVGNLGRDPEMRYTQNGKAVTKLSMAATVGYGDNQKTIWFRVTCWGKTAEAANNYLSKGSKVLVSGELTPGDNGNPAIWTTKDGNPAATFEINADTVKFLDSRKEAAGEYVDELKDTFKNADPIPF